MLRVILLFIEVLNLKKQKKATLQFKHEALLSYDKNYKKKLQLT